MSINKAILSGHVGNDPESKTLDSGITVTKFSLATSEKYTKKDGTEVDNTVWHNIVTWRGIAEVCEKYVKKGMKLTVLGKITNRSWEDDKGEKKYMTEIVADQVELPGRKESSDSAAPSTPPSVVDDEGDLPF